MRPIFELIIKGGDPEKISAVACGKCRFVAPSREAAENCCDPRCQTCTAPLTVEQTRRHSTRCEPCEQEEREAWARQREAEEVAALRKARHVPASEWGSFVYDESEYHSTVEEFITSCEDDDETPPAWVWGTDSIKLGLSADDIITTALECQEHHEDARDWISGEAELQELLDAWVKKHASGVETYFADQSVAVIIDAEAVAALLADEVQP